jgi:hypothetical protein
LIALATARSEEDGALSAKTSTVAFFSLLGACALTLFLAARWWRSRRERLRRLALEREAALDAAEEELAIEGKIRRQTLYSLAAVDAEATRYGENAASLGASYGGTRRTRAYGPAERPRRLLQRLNPFTRDRKHARMSVAQARRISRAASGVFSSGPRVSLARRVDRLDRLDRLSRAERRAESRFAANPVRSAADDSSSTNEFSEDRDFEDDEEAVFESAVLAAARRATQFEKSRRRGSRSRGFENRSRDERDARKEKRRDKRVNDSEAAGLPLYPSENATLLSDVIVETAEEDPRRPWKMFRGKER